MKKQNAVILEADEGKYLRKDGSYYGYVVVREGESEEGFEEVDEILMWRDNAFMDSDKFRIGILSRGVSEEALNGLDEADKAILAEPEIHRNAEGLEAVIAKLGLTTEDLDGIFGLARKGGGDGEKLELRNCKAI